MTAVPTLETPRLILRAPELTDAPAYQRHFADYEVIRYLSPLVPWPYPSHAAAGFLEKVILPKQGKDFWAWGLFLKDNPTELIGALELRRHGDPGQRGFWLGKAFHGRGLMTEACAAVQDFAFDVLGFETLCYVNAVGNIGSRRVKEKQGARFLRIEAGKFADPSLTEQEVWQLDAADWRRFKAQQQA